MKFCRWNENTQLGIEPKKGKDDEHEMKVNFVTILPPWMFVTVIVILKNE